MEDRYHTSIYGTGKIINRRHLSFYSYDLKEETDIRSYEPNISLKSDLTRRLDFEKALENYNDRNLVISKYAMRNLGESDNSYAIRLELFKHFLDKGIGPARSENLSSLLLNKLMINVEYPEYNQDIINTALDK